jgi:hypothetical protein
MLKGIEIFGPADCPIAHAQNGEIYALDAAPGLPLNGCKRNPWCICTYVGVPEHPLA